MPFFFHIGNFFYFYGINYPVGYRLMIIRILLLITLLGSFSQGFSLTLNLTWIGGEKAGPLNNGIGTLPVYGPKGSPGITFTPGSRSGSATWTDTDGNLWLFGGKAQAPGTVHYYNDLWKYSPNTQQWTWISGTNAPNSTGNYGLKGVASVSHYPGAREKSVTWADNLGNLYLLGGFSLGAPDDSGYIGDSNDFWQYNITSGMWTWLRGGSALERSGSYGNQNSGSITTFPPARSGASSWKFQDGTFGLFGGSLQNDLWIYNPASKIWTWKKGYNNSDFKNGIYGTRGVAESYTVPGVRENAVTWVDNYNTVWLFGGFGHASTGTAGYLNDLWRYNPNSNQWTWMHGYAVINETGRYGSLGEESAITMPGARRNAVSWIDNSGTLWLSGGFGFSEQNNSLSDLNDIWSFRPKSNFWTWQKGSRLSSPAWAGNGFYGTRDVTSPDNIAPGKSSAAVWNVTNRLTYFYGGDTNLSYNFKHQTEDFWKIETITGLPDGNNGKPPADNPPPPVAAPSNLSLRFEPPNSVKLTWQDNSDNETVIKVYRKSQTDTVFSIIANLPPDTISYTDTGLVPNQTYMYRIEAVNSVTEMKGISEVAVISTINLSSPTNIRTQYIEPSTVQIDWNHNGSNQIQYRIWRKKIGDTNDLESLGLLPPFSTWFTDSNVEKNSVYTYYIDVEHTLSDAKFRSIGITVSTFPPVVEEEYDLAIENVTIIPKLKVNKKKGVIKGAGQILGTLDIKNYGTVASDQASFIMYLSYSPNLSGTVLSNINQRMIAPISGGDLVTISPGMTETVNKKGKIKKKVIKFKLPPNTQYSGLYLHIVLDKNGETEDFNPENNSMSFLIESMLQ